MTQIDPHDGRSWNQYSARWGMLDEAGLGVEWGTAELTQRVFDNCLRPHLTAKSHVLEIGPGGGKYSVLSAPLCERLVLADVSTQMLARAQQALANCDNVEFLRLGGVDLSGIADDSIDFAFSIDVFVHLDLEDIYGYLREMHRVLRPGSAIVLHFPNLQSRAGWACFHQIADFNRALRRQVGRINFVTVETITGLFEQLRFGAIEVDMTSCSTRDFVVTARKTVLPTDPELERRQERVVARAQASEVAVDFIQRLAYGVQAPSDEGIIASEEYECAGERRQIINAPPDARLGFALTVPDNAVLSTGLALHAGGQVGGEECGVTFEVRVVCAVSISTVLSMTLDPATMGSAEAWTDVTIDLDEFAGKIVFLVFETRIAEGAQLANGACWSEPAIVLGCKRTREARPRIERVHFHDPTDDLTTERDNLRLHTQTIELERDALLHHVSTIETELHALRAHVPVVESHRDALVRHVANIERDYEALCEHVANMERDARAVDLSGQLEAYREHAASLEGDLAKIRSNPVYRVLCRIRGLFGSPKVS